ncbi:hypothetical protein ACLF6K_00490 [Streptomyces xanthophaeus]|uniref:hypothetical protein n=1 Tax=Streptomyces xanthophaeus TaxID=67385 RepID=UPI00398FF763
MAEQVDSGAAVGVVVPAIGMLGYGERAMEAITDWQSKTAAFIAVPAYPGGVPGAGTLRYSRREKR